MKYVHDNFVGVKYYCITNSCSWSGRSVVKEYRNGVFATSLDLDPQTAETFKQRLKENGWYAVGSGTDCDDSRGSQKDAREKGAKSPRHQEAERAGRRTAVDRRPALRG